MMNGNYIFRRARGLEEVSGDLATVKGVNKKSILLLVICFVAACLTIGSFALASAEQLLGLLIFYVIATIATAVLQIIISFKPTAARGLSIPYVIMEGLIIGVLCAVIELAFPGEGLVISAVALLITLGITLSAAIIYNNHHFTIPSKVVKILIIVLFGFCIASIGFSLIALIVRLCGGANLWAVYATSKLGILISFVSVLLAAIFVYINIQQIDQICTAGIDACYEWFLAFGLAVTVIWLFLEVLELLLRILARSKR